jgi:hypothetical protein
VTENGFGIIFQWGGDMKKFNSGWIECPHYEQYERPVIVCLCGSTRFWREFQEASLRETLAGRIVLSIGAARCADGDDKTFGGYVPADEFDRVKESLDRLHCEKINLADEVLVLNVGGYVGDSTRREVLHAARRYKVVRWLEPHSVPTDLAHLGDSQCGGPLVHRDGV